MKHILHLGSLLMLVTITAVISACGEPVSEESQRPSLVTAESAYQRFVSDGLTCETKKALSMLSVDEAKQVRQVATESLTPKQIQERLASEERPCTADSVSGTASGIGTVTQAITSTWSYESIEETYLGGGNTPSWVFRDAPAYGWMCNPNGAPGTWYDPADWIIQVNVYGGYANRSGLRVYGVTSCGSCAIPGSLSSRVYSDNDIRSCLGYWSAWFCCSTPSPSDFRYGLP